MIAFPVDRERSLDYHPSHRPSQAGRESSRHASPQTTPVCLFLDPWREDPSTVCWRSLCWQAAIKGEKEL